MGIHRNGVHATKAIHQSYKTNVTGQIVQKASKSK
jgi:hypothetical protein